MNDPGAFEERTTLAWQRTGLVGSLVGGGAVLAAAHRGSAVLVVLTGLTAAAGAAVAFVTTRPPADRTGWPASPWFRLVATAAVPVLLALLGTVLALG